MEWTRRRASVVAITAVLVLGAIVVAPGVAQPLPATSQPELALNRLIRTSPFVGSNVSVRDNEGSAYVARDDSLWIVDDNRAAAFEINRTTGALRRTISGTAFANALQLGGGPAAGTGRNGDFEAVAYDATADVLYVLSGSTASLPTVYRLTRDAGNQFQVESWQPLASEHTAAGWRLADGLLYVGNGANISTYNYSTGALGPAFSIPGITGLYGIDFDDASGDLVAVNTNERLFRASMSTRTILPGWNLDLTPFGIADSRAVEVIGEQVFVSDGLDTRPATDPMNHAVFVLDVGPRVVTVHLSAAEQTRNTQLLAYYNEPNTEALLKFGILVVAYLIAVSPPSPPTPLVFDPPGTALTQTVTWGAVDLNRLDTVRARYVVNNEDAHRVGFLVLSYIAWLNGR